MELNSRSGADRFVPARAYGALEAQLRRRSDELAEIPTVIFSAFDRSTRLLPFVIYESRLFPAGPAMVAAALNQAGFRRTRAVFQLWNPNFRAAHARLHGRPLQMLLVSTLQINSRSAYAVIQDARSARPERPLIIAGGPKAIYEPYDFWWTAEGKSRPAPDAVVTGEVYVLLDLLNLLVQFRARGETLLAAFERARREGSLESIPGLVYLAPRATPEEPVLIDTGLQRLVQDLDEFPSAATALSLMEPPHQGTGLWDQPIADFQVLKYVMFVSLLATQGCRFTCPYCPIPAANQRSWRYRSPQSLIDDISTIHERFGVKYFFFSDDNFFNHRDTAEQLLSEMARAKNRGRRFGKRIRFGTEATEIDTYKNRDLLPVAREAGMHSIWFGIEDLTASLVKKGQSPARSVELFRLMRELRSRGEITYRN